MDGATFENITLIVGGAFIDVFIKIKKLKKISKIILLINAFIIFLNPYEKNLKGNLM